MVERSIIVENTRPAPQKPRCVSGGLDHKWIIESPNGKTSDGVCKLCGNGWEFSNITPDLSSREFLGNQHIGREYEERQLLRGLGTSGQSFHIEDPYE